jgi:hypothetical protein
MENKKRDENKKHFQGNFLNKKGLSAIVITLIIVGLSLVAVGIVWGVVSNLIQGGTSNVEASIKCVNVMIGIDRASCVNGATNKICNVTVSRSGTEQEALGGVKIRFADTVSETYGSLISLEENIVQLEGRTFTSLDSGVPNANEVNLVEVTPYFLDDAGKEQLCTQVSKFEF